MNPSNDKEAITLILEGLVAAGHTLGGVIDDTWNKDEIQYPATIEDAVALVTGVDEAFVYMDGQDAYIYFVLGNDPEEVASDYTTNLDPDLSNITDPWWE